MMENKPPSSTPLPTHKLMEKLRMLMVWEKKLLNLQAEYHNQTRWIERIRLLTDALSQVNTTEEALHQLTEVIAQHFPYEFAGIKWGPRVLLSTGGNLSEAIQQRIQKKIEDIKPSGAIEIMTDKSRTQEEPVQWLIVGPVDLKDQNPFYLCAGRTSLTSGFFPGPWDREKELFAHVLGMLSPVFASIRFREELWHERQSLKQQVGRATKQLQIALEDAQQSRKAAEAANQAKSLFLANMSHELRTPLNAIIGYTELLLEEVDELGTNTQTVLAPDIQKIHSSGGYLLSLVNNILDLSKIEAGHMELHPEAFTVEGAIHDLWGTANLLAQQNRNELKMELAHNVGLMYSDLTKIRQILLNLLGNAAKFTQKGQIRLTVYFEEDEDAALLVPPEEKSYRVPEGWYRFEIHDSGIGMTPQQSQKAFEIFSQADSSIARDFGGTGLGLAICRKFCEMLGGGISVESELHRGSCFTVRLPSIIRRLS